jgi:hypothetical protein
MDRSSHRSPVPTCTLWEGEGRRGKASDSVLCLYDPRAMSLFLGPWLKEYSVDFIETQDFPYRKQMVAYLQLNMPDS